MTHHSSLNIYHCR